MCHARIISLAIALALCMTAATAQAVVLPVVDDLVLWLRADAGVTPDGGKVSQWDDQLIGDNTYANNAVQAIGSNRPTLVQDASPNGALPMVRFGDGSNTFLAIADHADLNPETGGYTVFLAGESTHAGTTPQGWLSKQASGSRLPGYTVWSTIGSTKTEIGVAASPQDLAGETSRAGQNATRPEGFRVITMQLTGNEVFGYLNGSNVGWSDGGSGPANNSYVGSVTNSLSLNIGKGYGAGYQLQGDVGEILMYKADLSAADRAKVEKYLYNKWSRPRDLLGHYRFDEAIAPPSSTVVDSSASANHGSLGSSVTGQSVNDPARVAGGPSGNALHFARGAADAGLNHQFVVGGPSNHYVPEAGAPLTFAAWVNPDTIGTGTTGHAAEANRILALYQVGSFSTGMGIALGGGIEDGGEYTGNLLATFRGTAPSAWTHFTSTGVLSTDDSTGPYGDGWRHVAMTYDGFEVTLYIDGVDVGGGALATYNAAGDTPIRIGAMQQLPYPHATRDDVFAGGFDGGIDDVQFYSWALDAADIQYLVNNPGIPIPEPTSASLLAIGGLCLLMFRRRTWKGID